MCIYIYIHVSIYTYIYRDVIILTIVIIASIDTTTGFRCEYQNCYNTAPAPVWTRLLPQLLAGSAPGAAAERPGGEGRGRGCRRERLGSWEAGAGRNGKKEAK